MNALIKSFTFVGIIFFALVCFIYSTHASSKGSMMVKGENKSLSQSKLSEDQIKEKGYQKATFAAGCFWGPEAAYRQVDGVVDTAVGFTGGTVENPSYKQVVKKKTGHAEVVEVIFDPAVVSYEKLVSIFWDIHDPTQLNRQGWDIGDQYRSEIFYHNEDQKKVALMTKEKLDKSGKLRKPIVTKVTAAGPFYKAEEYHQRYFEKTGKKGSGHH